MDSGTFLVNTEDTILTGKVQYLTHDSALILSRKSLVCRPFASARSLFELPLERLTFVRANHDDRTMTLGGLFPRETPGQLFQTSMFMEFSSKIDRDEWVSTLNHVITDRNVRQHNEQERKMKERQATVAELGTMFPLVDPEILQTIYAQNNFNMNLTVDALLVLSDPTYSETHGAAGGLVTSTPLSQMEQDEMLALALQDENFLEHVRSNPALRDVVHPRSTESASGSNQGSSSPTMVKKFSEATRETITNLYRKFQVRRHNRVRLDDDQNGDSGQEMVSISATSHAPNTFTIDDSNGLNLDSDSDTDDRLIDRRVAAQPTSAPAAAPAPTASTQRPAGNGEAAVLVAIDDDQL